MGALGVSDSSHVVAISRAVSSDVFEDASEEERAVLADRDFRDGVCKHSFGVGAAPGAVWEGGQVAPVKRIGNRW